MIICTFQIVYTDFLFLQHSPKSKAVVRVDGANGVGAIKVASLIQCMQSSHAHQYLDILVYNDGSAGELNLNVSYCCIPQLFMLFSYKVCMDMSNLHKRLAI